MSVLKGRLKIWDEEQGYGVISTADDLGDVRFELADFMGTQKALAPGDALAFSLKASKGGRLQACRMQPVGILLGSLNTSRLSLKQGLMILSPFVLSVLALPITLLPLLLYTCFSLVAVGLISQDLNRAKPFAIKRNTLLAIELWGGWPGSYLSQALLDHANSDPIYQRLSKHIPLAHIIIWACSLLSVLILF